MKKVLIVFSIIYLSLHVFAEEEVFNEAEVTSIINKYRTLVLKKLDDTLCLHVSTRNLGKKLLSNPLDNKTITVNRRYIFNVLKSTSLQFSNRRVLNKGGYLTKSFTTGFIEEEKYYRLWVELFNCDDYEFKDWAYRILRDHSRLDYLKKYSSEIRQGIIEYRHASCELEDNNKGCNKLIKQNIKYKDINQMLPGDKLFMLLPLSEDEKKLMLKKNIPLHYRARMGDREAEKELIKKFNETTEVLKNSKIENISIGEGNAISSEACKLAKKLGLIGTDKCAKTLIRALNFNVPRRTWRYRSLRIDIILALAKIHPDVPFLRMDISFIDQHGDKSYSMPYKNKEDIRQTIQKYLNKVIEWGKKTYNTSPVSPSPIPFLRVFMVMTPRYPYGGKRNPNITNITDEDLEDSEIFNANAIINYPDSVLKKHNESTSKKGLLNQ